MREEDPQGSVILQPSLITLFDWTITDSDMDHMTPHNDDFMMLALAHSIMEAKAIHNQIMSLLLGALRSHCGTITFIHTFNLTFWFILTHYCLSLHKKTQCQNFDFNLRRDHQKNFLLASRLWVGRRKEPILGYVPKNYEKNNSGSNGLNN